MSGINAIRLFGSKIRGDDDSASDTDILIVSNEDNFSTDEIDKDLRVMGYQNLSYSLYGQERIVDMYKTGHLFAWHLYYESKPIYEANDFITALGKPSEYNNALSDILEFEKLIAQIPSNLEYSKYNAIYESGILYICSRNIALCASMQVLERPCYSRYSPFEVSEKLGLFFPLTLEQYNACHLCRKDGMQGKEASPLQNLSYESDSVLEWIHRIKRYLNNV